MDNCPHYRYNMDCLRVICLLPIGEKLVIVFYHILEKRDREERMKKNPSKILIIDDDPVLIRILEKRLKVDGYEVVGALSGQGGLKRAQEDIPDLILLDLMIPDINGVDVAKQLRSNELTKEIPIICMSVTLGVENDQGDEEIEIDGEFFRVFAKPLHNRKLLSVMRKTINRAKDIQQQKSKKGNKDGSEI